MSSLLLFSSSQGAQAISQGAQVISSHKALSEGHDAALSLGLQKRMRSLRKLAALLK